MLCLITMPEKMGVVLPPYPTDTSMVVPGKKPAALLTGNVASAASPS